MKRFASILILILLFLLLFFSVADAHPGRTDSNGGHYDRSTGEYHYHHGYPAHQHINGVCPYDFDDRTGESSGGSSSRKTTTESTTEEVTEPDQKESKEEPTMVSFKVFIISFIVLSAIVVVLYLSNRNELGGHIDKLYKKDESFDSDVLLLKQKVASLEAEVEKLEKENRMLRDGIFALDGRMAAFSAPQPATEPNPQQQKLLPSESSQTKKPHLYIQKYFSCYASVFKLSNRQAASNLNAELKKCFDRGQPNFDRKANWSELLEECKDKIHSFVFSPNTARDAEALCDDIIDWYAAHHPSFDMIFKPNRACWIILRLVALVMLCSNDFYYSIAYLDSDGDLLRILANRSEEMLLHYRTITSEESDAYQKALSKAINHIP